MSNTISTRIPVDDRYVALIGRAVYVFAYYEWTVIYIIEYLSPGFVQEYSRDRVMTSDFVRRRLLTTINEPSVSFAKVPKRELELCCDTFQKLIVDRNALIHAHPITDATGSQILAYQTKISKPLPDMHWSTAEIEAVIHAFDSAACRAGDLLDRLR